MKKFLGDVARLWGYHWPTIVWKVNNGPWIKCARKSDRGSSAPKKSQQIFSWKGGWWLDYGAICWPTIVLGVNEGTPLTSLAAPSHWEKNLPTGKKPSHWVAEGKLEEEKKGFNCRSCQQKYGHTVSANALKDSFFGSRNLLHFLIQTLFTPTTPTLAGPGGVDLSVLSLQRLQHQS